MGDVKSDVKDMLDALGGFAPDGAPATDPPDDAPATDAPAPAPETDEPAPETDEPETDAPTTNEPSEDDKFAELMRKNQELEDKIKSLEDKGREPPKTEAPTTDPPISDADFASDLDLDELSRDPESLNKVLNTVYKKAVETVRDEYKNFGRKTFESIPEVIDQTLTTKQNLQKMTENFYKDNEDLKPWAKTVGVVFQEVMAENPDTDFGEALNKTETLVRERIGIEKNTTKSRTKSKNDAPPLPRKKGSRVRPKPKETGTVKSEISEMNESLNR